MTAAIHFSNLAFAGAFAVGNQVGGQLGKTSGCVYRRLIIQISLPFLSDSEEAQIQTICSRSDLPESNRAQSVFDIVLRARLKLLAPEVAAGVKVDLENSKKILANDLYGEYLHAIPSDDGPNGYIKYMLPESLAETAVDYLVKIHELEHSVQRNAIVAAGRAKGEGQADIPPYVDRYLRERGAVRLEWEFLRRIPAVERERLAQQTGPQLKPDTQWITLALKSADKPFEDYFREQSSLRGYSKTAIRSAASVNGEYEFIQSAAVIAFVSILAITSAIAIGSLF